MRIKKKPALILLMIVSMLCLIFGAVACGGGAAKDAIEMYILPENETLVSADFTLPKTIGKDVEVTWKSSNTNVITIEDGGEAYTAKVTLPTEVTPVTLTVSAGNHSKDFTVRVDAFSVYTFVKNFKFAQRNVAVKEGFDLETEMTLQGKKATITWAIDSQYSHLIKLNDAKNKVEVIPGEDVSPVEITATFTYDGKSADQTYPFSVSPVLKHLQTVNRYYSRTGYPLELSGYIVHVYEASESYGNATFYMIDDDFCSGYYCYRAKINTADIDKYVAGAHITFSGDTTKNYSGLWENNSGGTAVVDDKPSIDPKSKVYDLDTDLIAGVPSLIWHESTYVRLTGWKVESKEKAKPKSGTTGTLFTLKKGGVSIDVTYTKYINFAEGEADKLINLYDTIEVGNFVTVTGLLGRHVSDSTAKSNAGFQVQPVLASDVVKVDSEAANENGAKVQAAVEAVDDAVKKNVPSLIASAKEFELPTSKEGVTVSYEVVGATNPTVTINGGKFNVNPTTIEHNYDVQVTYSIGDYKAYGFFSVHNWKLTDKEIVEKVSSDLEYTFPEDVKLIGEYDPPVVDDLGATVTWAVKASSPSWISVVNGKIKVVFLPQQETEVILVATVTLNSESKSVEVPIKILADPMVDFTALEEVKAGTYKFAMYSDNKKATYYATGAMDGYYFATSEDFSKAADFVITKIGDENKYTITVGGKYLEFAARASGTEGVDILMNDKQTEGKYWQWIDGIKNFVMESAFNKGGKKEATDTDLYYFGNYNTNTTMNGNYISRIAKKGDDGSYTASGTEGVSQWVAHFGTMEKITHRHYYENFKHTADAWTHTGTCSQPGCDQTTVTEDCRPEQNVCPKCGYEYSEAEILAKLSALESGGSLLGTYKLKGKVKEITDAYTDKYKNVTFIITVGSTEIECYREKSTYSATVKAGDTVTVTGALKNNNGKPRFDSGCAIVETDGTTTQPEEPEVPETGSGTETDPYNVAKALAVCAALEADAYSEAPVYVTGYVISVGSWGGKNWSRVYIGDAADAATKDGLQIYTLSPDATYLKLQNDLAKGMKITVLGYLQNYKGSSSSSTLEMGSHNDVNVTAVAYTDTRTVAQKITDALNAVSLPVKVMEDITLPQSTVTGVTLAFTSDNTAITVGTDKLTVTRGTADVSVKITVSANAEGGTAQTKDLTVVVRSANTMNATLSFASKNNRTTQTTETQVWTQNGITFTNNKGTGSPIADYSKPVRCYQGSSIKVEFTSAVKEIVFHCNDASYASALQKSITAENVTVTVSGQDVTVLLTTPATAFEVANLSAQVRFDSIDVFYDAPAAATSVAPVAILPGKEF